MSAKIIQAILGGNPSLPCIFLLEESVQRFFHRDLLLSFSCPSKMPEIQRFRDRLRLSVTRIPHTKRQKIDDGRKKIKSKRKFLKEDAIVDSARPPLPPPPPLKKKLNQRN